MLPGIEVTELIRAIGVLGIMGIIFAESGLLLGFFLPGDTLLFSAGLLATKGIFGVNIHVLVLYMVLAAVVGEATGYWFGHKVGHRIFRRKDSLFFHPENLQRAERFYESYGPATIMLARFIPVVRTFVPIVAGAAKMNWRSFTLYNVLGAVMWIGLVTYTGYFSGAWLEAHGISIETLVMPVILLVMLLTLGSPLIHMLRDSQSRATLLARFRRK